jgi:7-cyano-7-deazaguanine tRNA-ribosyltransferase
MGFKGIITNAYLLKKNVGIYDDVHEYLKFNGVIMTDSGAYQILKYGKIDVSNEEIVKYQCKIKTDIGVILDIPTPYTVTYDEAFSSALETYNRAQKALEIITTNQCQEILWVLPIQGGVYVDVVKEFAQKSVELFYNGFSIFALGSPTTLLEQYLFDKVIDMIFAARSTIPFSAPLHLFGAGHPLLIPFAVALGVDLFDSASYILYAKDDRYISRKGTYRLSELEYFPCSCPICSKHSPKELLEMPKDERIKHLSKHNLYVIREEVNEVKQAIKEGRFWEYLEIKAYLHPATKSAFKALLKYLEYLYKHTSYSKPGVKAVLLTSHYSVYNPRVQIPRRKILSKIHMCNKSNIVFIPYVYKDKILLNNFIGSVLKQMNEELDFTKVYVYYPIIGVVPQELLFVFPYSQFEFGVEITDEIIEDLAYLIFESILLLKKDSFIAIAWCVEAPWQQKLISKLIRSLSASKVQRSVKIITLQCNLGSYNGKSVPNIISSAFTNCNFITK